MSTLSEIERVSKAFFQRVELTEDGLFGRDKGRKSEADRSVDVKGAVKLSTAVTALHLACARWTVRAWPEYLLGKIKSIAVKGTARTIAKIATVRALKAAPGANLISTLITEGFGNITDAAIADEVEEMIRTAFLKVRRELNESVMGKSRRARKVRDVLTRHVTKPKRKDSRWKSR